MWRSSRLRRRPLAQSGVYKERGLVPTGSPRGARHTQAATFLLLPFILYKVIQRITRLNFKDFGQKSHTALPTFLFVLRSQTSMCGGVTGYLRG